MNLVITNISIYEAIAQEAFDEVIDLDTSLRTPKNSGSGGFIFEYDPTYKSFKKSMIVVVFTGIWLEAFLHLEIVKAFGESEFKKVDRTKSYEEKLEIIGINDSELLKKVNNFRETRRELVHEKAFMDKGEIKKAQEEATLANEVMREIINNYKTLQS